MFDEEDVAFPAVSRENPEIQVVQGLPEAATAWLWSPSSTSMASLALPAFLAGLGVDAGPSLSLDLLREDSLR